MLYVRDGGKFFHSFTGLSVVDEFLDDKAIRYYQMAADAYPQSWAARDGLGAAYAAQGDKQRSRAMYEKSLQLNPQNENARKALSSY